WRADRRSQLRRLLLRPRRGPRRHRAARGRWSRLGCRRRHERCRGRPRGGRAGHPDHAARPLARRAARARRHGVERGCGGERDARPADRDRGAALMRVPRSSYRLQVTPGFPLAEVAAVTDYVHALGADWLYLSPLLAATPGSMHGYDVVDPTRVDPSRGGPDGLEAAAAAARARGLGILVDIVPNHMGVGSPPDNPWWWDVLRRGRQSRYASFFDIDWEFGDGRVRLPVLGDDGLDALRIEDGELRSHGHRLPIADGTADDGADPVTVHSRQH